MKLVLVLGVRMNMRVRVNNSRMRVPVRVDQVGAQQQFVIAENFCRRPIGRNPALFQHDDAVGDIFDDL